MVLVAVEGRLAVDGRGDAEGGARAAVEVTGLVGHARRDVQRAEQRIV